MAKANAKRSRKPAAKTAPAKTAPKPLPVDLQMIDQTLAEQDNAILDALTAGNSIRQDMASEIAMLRQQVATLEAARRADAKRIADLQDAWALGRPDMAALFAMPARIEREVEALDLERSNFYARRMAAEQPKDEPSERPDTEERAREPEEAAPLPGFLTAPRDPLHVNGEVEEPRDEYSGGSFRNIAAAFVAGIGLSIIGWWM